MLHLFAAVKVILVAVSDGKLLPGNALQVNGLFYHLMQEADPVYSKELHDRDSIKPYTLSSMKWEGGGHWQNEVVKGNKYSFKITFMEAKAFQLLHRSLMEYYTNKLIVKVGDLNFNIDNIELLKMELVEDILTKPLDFKKFRIDFISPTSFRRHGINWLFPDTHSIFKSLLIKCNALNLNIDLSEEELEEINNYVFPVKYDLKTRLFNMGNYKMVGFEGNCHYEVKSALSETVKNKICTMLKLANYSGVGYKTTMGLGQVVVSFGK